jgi:hypothetical protein
MKVIQPLNSHASNATLWVELSPRDAPKMNGRSLWQPIGVYTRWLIAKLSEETLAQVSQVVKKTLKASRITQWIGR